MGDQPFYFWRSSTIKWPSAFEGRAKVPIPVAMLLGAPANSGSTSSAYYRESVRSYLVDALENGTMLT